MNNDIWTERWNERYRQADFAHYEFIELQETEVYLNEGLYHRGAGSVIRFMGRKL